jgi:uncharacterized membrane protein YoaK (UPF0700 family)
LINPPSSDVRSARWIAILLALVAGYVDAYSLLAYGLFVSFMSGNTTQAGSMFGHAAWLAAVPAVLAIFSFVIGSTAGTWIARSRLPQARQVLLGAIAAVLLIILTSTQLDSAALPTAIVIPMLGAAMGMMNAAHSHIGAEPLSITFVTGTLHRIGAHIALALRREPVPDAQGPWDTHLRRAANSASVWAGFLGGATISAMASPRFGVWALLAPLLGLLALIVWLSCRRHLYPPFRIRRRSDPGIGR